MPRLTEPTMTDADFADVNDKADYQYWLRRYDLGWEADCSRYRCEWSRSGSRGRNEGIIDRQRRKTFGPGKYWAATAAGVFLNKSFVKGWRGVNPKNP